MEAGAGAGVGAAAAGRRRRAARGACARRWVGVGTLPCGVRCACAHRTPHGGKDGRGARRQRRSARAARATEGRSSDCCARSLLRL